jgi:hypothetical protein
VAFSIHFPNRDDDVRRFNAQTDQLNLFKSDYTKLQKRVESLEKANTELQNQAAMFVILPIQVVGTDF